MSLWLLTSLAAAQDAGATSAEAGLPRDLPAWAAWAGDSDGDGLLELITVAHKQWMWLEQDASGSFQPAEHKLEDKIDRHGMAGCDVDRDGRDELLIAVGGNRGAGGLSAELWSFAGEQPENLGSEILAGTEGARMRGATCSDFDGDGSPELWLPAMGKQWPDRLVMQGEDGQWSEQAEARGLAQLSTVMGGSWGDVDGDGDLDLVRIHERKAELLLQQDGVFGEPLQLPVEGVTDLVLEDLDGDGDPDLYVATEGERFDAAAPGYVRLRVGGPSWADYEVPSGCGPIRVAIQGDVNGQPAEIVHASGSFKISGRVGQPELSEDKPQGQGVAIWRVEPRRLRLESSEGKGHAQIGLRCKKSGEAPPLLEASLKQGPDAAPVDHIFLNDDGSFVDSALPLPSANVRDVIPADVDLDGDLDLFLVTSMNSVLEGNPPDLLLVNEGGAFSQHELEQPKAPVEGYLGLAVDLDGDAYPELVSFNGEHFVPLAGQPTVWNNPGGDNAFIRVVARDGQATALSARVQVETRAGVQTRLSNPSPDWRSNGGTAQVFGIGQASKARVTVTWADGSKSKARAKAGQTVVVDKR